MSADTQTGPVQAGGFGIYIHWPFCQSKCPYCDFNSHVVRGLEPQDWTASYLREVGYWADKVGAQKLDSIFFGGGTPSLMAPQTVEAILRAIDSHWPISPDVEITLEANPTSVEAARFQGFRQAGINRVSLGVQALNDADLKFLGRLHTSDEALRALDIAGTYFGRTSLDLIYARPGQSLEAWQAELARALSFGTDHLSLYQLTIEEGTPFSALHRAGAFAVPDEELAATLYEMTQEMSASAGRPAYEISNHAKPGHECRHNLVYWRYGGYLGLGPGAHGRLPIEGRRLATQNLNGPTQWRAQVEHLGQGLEAQNDIDAATQGEEMIMMGLRLSEGVSLSRYEKISRRKIDPDQLAQLERNGLVSRAGDRLAATPQGALVLNRLIAELLR